MRPWDWLDQPGTEFKIAICQPPYAGFHVCEQDRAFIVAACRAFENASICQKCGGISWGIPLENYCKCEFKETIRGKQTLGGFDDERHGAFD